MASIITVLRPNTFEWRREPEGRLTQEVLRVVVLLDVCDAAGQRRDYTTIADPAEERTNDWRTGRGCRQRQEAQHHQLHLELCSVQVLRRHRRPGR
jgi:hypothetical protein